MCRVAARMGEHKQKWRDRHENAIHPMNDNNDEKEKEQIKKASNRRNHNCYSGWRKKRGEPYNNNNQLVVS